MTKDHLRYYVHTILKEFKKNFDWLFGFQETDLEEKYDLIINTLDGNIYIYTIKFNLKNLTEKMILETILSFLTKAMFDFYNHKIKIQEKIMKKMIIKNY